jgi:death on curing protein
MGGPHFLTLDDALSMHVAQIERFGGAAGILDMGKLESALAQPRQSFGGQYLHEDIAAMAAAYLFHVVQNHPFEDGNKRTGTGLALLFLELNDVEDPFSDEDIIDLTLAVASGQMSKDQLIAAFRQKLHAP